MKTQALFCCWFLSYFALIKVRTQTLGFALNTQLLMLGMVGLRTLTLKPASLPASLPPVLTMMTLSSTVRTPTPPGLPTMLTTTTIWDVLSVFLIASMANWFTFLIYGHARLQILAGRSRNCLQFARRLRRIGFCLHVTNN